MDVVAVILARGGSKGIPLKNLVKLNGLSLLANAILVSKNANVFAQVWVSTDNRRIAAEADRYGAHVHYRPSHLAADKTPSIDAVLEFVQCHRHIQNVALIQCTSVFIKELYLEAAVAAFQSPHVDCVFSALRCASLTSHSVVFVLLFSLVFYRNWKLRWAHTPDNKLEAINFDASNRPRRQDWNGELIEAGMFYFARRQLIVDNRVFQNDRFVMILICVDGDTTTHIKTL